jgi:DNA-binding helix-hairpin-helix protein with protein kinase domain
MAFAFLAVIAAVALSAVLGQLSAIAAGAVSLLAVLVFVAFTIFLFRKTPEWRAKHAKLIIFKESRAEASKIAREVAKWDAARNDIDSRERKAVDKISSRADKARAAEQKELADVNTRLASQIQRLQKQRLSLQSSEDKESANALRLLQEQHVNAYLSRSAIRSAKIPGIGPAIVGSLAANGVMTAADFTGIAYSVGPRAGTRQVFVRHRNGYDVHPTGVGEKKADALDSWRRALEMRARATQPSRLPSAQAQAIKAKYMQQRQNLANEEQAAHARAPIELKQISQKWMQTHTSISAELVSARQVFAQERARADVQLTAAQKQASATAWQRDLAVREISAHRNINYLQYLTGITKILQ